MDDAVDIRGQRYVEMPYAYQYRTAYNPSIRCAVSTPVIAAASLPQTVAQEEPTVRVPLPLPRPERSEDPETLANRAGNLTLHWPDEDPGLLMANGVRLIGPAFYYAQ